MLSENGTNKMVLLKEVINQKWGYESRIIHEKIFNAPFDMFKICVKLYNNFEVLIEYDRSIIAISIKIDESFINLRKLTKLETIKGFKSSDENSILHNFEVLDITLQEIRNNDLPKGN